MSSVSSGVWKIIKLGRYSKELIYFEFGALLSLYTKISFVGQYIKSLPLD